MPDKELAPEALSAYANCVAFKKLFLILSTFFLTFFYFIPLVAISTHGSPLYISGQSLNFQSKAIDASFFFGALFSISFFAFSIALIKKHPPPNQERHPKHKTRHVRIIQTAAIAYALGSILYAYFFIDSAHNYAIRRGETQGSHLELFISITLSTLGFFLILESDSLGLKKTAILLLLCSLYVAVVSVSGRTNSLIYLGMLFFAITNAKISTRYIFAAGLLFVAALPIILQLKSILFSLLLNGAWPNLSDIYLISDSTLKSYIDNFGHPAISIINTEKLIQETEYRYFYDYLHGFLFYLRAFGIQAGDSLAYYNTHALIGVRESIIPPGYIAFGFIQLHFLGVIVSGLTWAAIGKLCNSVRARLFPSSKIATFYFSFVAANTFYHGEIRIIAMTTILPIILMLLFKKASHTIPHKLF